MWKKVVLVVSLALNVLFVLYLSYLTYSALVGESPKPQVLSDPEIDGYVPDSLTAIGIARSVLLPIYGKDHIERHSPFVAGLLGDTIWRITGSRHKGSLNQWELGGSPFIDINKKDGKVINSGHSK